MIRSVPSSKTSKLMYGGFTGLDTSRSEVVHEVNEHQSFADVDNAYIDWSGYVSNERAIERIGKEGRYISHVRFAYNGEILYATRGEQGISIWNSHELESGRNESEIVFPTNTITSTLSNGEVVFCAGEAPYRYVAQEWKRIDSPDAYGATLCASVSGRLALAGFKDAPTVVRFSRVDDNEIFECDEDVADIQVTKAGGINLKTVLNRAETITALFPFGANQLLIFTNARCLIYEINADLTTWKQVSDVHIYVGCVSQNSICGWANEVIFCSRYGIYTLKRSVANGTALVVLPYSHKVQSVYQELLSQLEDPRLTNAVFDSDCGRYHIFFPLSPRGASRLSCSVSPVAQEEGSSGSPSWSFSEYGNLTCGDFLDGKLLMGSCGGIWRMKSEYEEGGDIGEAVFSTPLLWMNERFMPKRGHQIGIIADGAGQIEVEVENEEGQILDVLRWDLPYEDQAVFHGTRKGRQFTRIFPHLFTGVKLKFHIRNVKKSLRIYGFTIEIKEQ